jgi:RHS repeat-associated protein
VNNIPVITLTNNSQAEHLYTNHLASVTRTRGSTTTNTTYTPFGSETSQTTTDTNRGYIGEESDSTGLSYLNARYYNPDLGRFISQDPVALFNPEKVVYDPQQLNMYSYAANSPISNSDRSGKILETALDVIFKEKEEMLMTI